MPMLLEFVPVRDHLRLPPDSDDVLTLIPAYRGAAIEYVRTFTGRDYPDDEPLPDAIVAAVLLLVADLYENREAQTERELRPNPAVDRLLWPYRTFA